ncbi:unnamed protein product [Pleuronectes platessa]|uniref:Uncharacterized protein n=1 Tax=Pleuronectes platessa TaxID=8262 RepID=A0A9N7YWA2_PLEPL|nr:unnamed protein product [Pleuronectes platessa]
MYPPPTRSGLSTAREPGDAGRNVGKPGGKGTDLGRGLLAASATGYVSETASGVSLQDLIVSRTSGSLSSRLNRTLRAGGAAAAVVGALNLQTSVDSGKPLAACTTEAVPLLTDQTSGIPLLATFINTQLQQGSSSPDTIVFPLKGRPLSGEQQQTGVETVTEACLTAERRRLDSLDPLTSPILHLMSQAMREKKRGGLRWRRRSSSLHGFVPVTPEAEAPRCVKAASRCFSLRCDRHKVLTWEWMGASCYLRLGAALKRPV